MRNVIKKEVKINDKTVTGIEVNLNDGHIVMIICDNGLLACGAIDYAVMEKFGFSAAIARGTPEKPLKYVDDLLNAKVIEVTTNAKSMDVKVGMLGKEVVEKFSYR